MITPFKGPHLDEFQVFINTADITALVDRVTINESIGSPFLSGSLEITDSAGFLDLHIKGNSYVLIKYVYRGTPYAAAFYLDGVHHVDFENIQHEKTYTVDLKSFNELSNAMSTVSKAFKGSADEVIKSIFENAGLGQLDIFSTALNSGKYIAPMAPPYACLFDILFRSYGQDHSPLFLFEQMAYRGPRKKTEQQEMLDEQDEGMDLNNGEIGSTILQSWNDMLNSTPKLTISPTIPLREEAAGAAYGMPKRLVVMHDHAAMTSRINSGVEVEEINTVDIHNTTHHIDTFNIHQKHYDSSLNTNPEIAIQGDLGQAKRTTINNMESRDQVRLCGNTEAENMGLSKCRSIRSKATAVSINAYECNAIPTLKSGDTLTLEVPIGTKSAGEGDCGPELLLSPKYKGKYVVGGITHMINCADMNYTQNINMIRDGGPVSDEETQ